MSPLHGLVLSGGRSTRMGTDKGALLHSSGLDHRTRGLELLGRFCARVFVSCRRDQAVLLPAGMPRIFDELEDVGPAAGILAARTAYPAAAWLVFACDFTYADEAAVAALVAARSPAHAATAYVNEKGFLEPLFAIWEPDALTALAADVREGRLSPGRSLSTLGVRTLRAREALALENMNAPASRPA